MLVEATASSARRAEADGAPTVTFDFRGASIAIPCGLEGWPLDAIRARKPASAVRALLVGQPCPNMRTIADVMELSTRMAEAVGVVPLPEDTTAGAYFGAIPTLLDVVDNYGDDIEADLLRFYGVDYRQPPERGGPTLRQVWVYLRRLPVESALTVARNKGRLAWTRTDIAVARLWEMWTQKPYPGRPYAHEEIEQFLERERADAAEMDRLKERENYYASGQNMRDAGRDPGPRPPRKPPPNTQPAREPELSPVAAALAVARRNAARSPKGENSNGRKPAGTAVAAPRFTTRGGRPPADGGSGW